MSILLLGSSGMLGTALELHGKQRGLDIIGVDIVSASRMIDITNDHQLVELLEKEDPDIIINTVAITDIEACESDLGRAYRVNSRPAAILAQECKKRDIYLVHISTDHYFTGDRMLKHNEKHTVELLNEYARTKYIAEKFTLTCDNSLVIRTNIVGFKRHCEKLTFADWIFQVLEQDAPIVLFDDYYCSSITVSQLSKYLLDLLPTGHCGVLNIGSSEVFSKKQFIERIAYQAGYRLTKARTGSIMGLQPRRAESLGLDVRKVEELLGQKMPSQDEVVNRLISEYRGG